MTQDRRINERRPGRPLVQDFDAPFEVLTEADFERIWNELGGMDAWTKTFGYYQFGFHVQDAIIERLQGADAIPDTETLAGQDWKAPVQSQAVPSELASARDIWTLLCEHGEYTLSGNYTVIYEHHIKGIHDRIQSLFSHSAATGEVPEAIRDALESARWALAKATELHALGFNECLANALPKGQADETGCTASQYKAAAEEIRESIAKTRDIVRAALASPAAPLAGKAEPESMLLSAEQMTDLFHAIARKNGIETISVNGKAEEDGKLVLTLAELFHVLSSKAEPDHSFDHLAGRGLHELRTDELPAYLSAVAHNHGAHSEEFSTAAKWVVSEIERKTNDERILAVQLANLRDSLSAPLAAVPAEEASRFTKAYVKDMEDTLSQIGALVGVKDDADALIAAVKKLVAPAEPAPILASADVARAGASDDELARAWMMSHGYGNQSVGYALADLQSRIEAKDRELRYFASRLAARSQASDHEMDFRTPEGLQSWWSANHQKLRNHSLFTKACAIWNAARLSKPTSQGTAQSIDTDDFRELMCNLGYWAEEDEGDRDHCAKSLIEFIDRHIAAQAPADRDATEYKPVGKFLYVGMSYEATSSDDPRGITLYRPAASHGAVEGEQK